MRRAAAILASALMLAGCTPQLDHGVVTGKTHHHAYSTVTYCGKGCFIPVYHPPTWKLHLRDADQTGDHDVTETEYDRYQIGDPYP